MAQKWLFYGSEILHGLLFNKNIRISHTQKICGHSLPPALCNFWADKGVYFQKLSYGSETLDMTSEDLGDVFEGDFADTCAEYFLLVLLGGQADPQTDSEDPHSEREKK